MFASRPEPSPQDAASRKGTWQRERVQSRAQINRVLERVYFALVRQRYSEQEIFGVCLALEEALVNAIKHGHRDRPGQCVQVRFLVEPEWVVVIVKDKGEGFDPSSVLDPCAPENLERPTGRGLFLMHSYMTWVRHNGRGNCVAMGKCRLQTPALPSLPARTNGEASCMTQQAPAARGGAGLTAHLA
jgi:serine/threonine-protein kinase RsbW